MSVLAAVLYPFALVFLVLFAGCSIGAALTDPTMKPSSRLAAFVVGLAGLTFVLL